MVFNFNKSKKKILICKKKNHFFHMIWQTLAFKMLFTITGDSAYKHLAMLTSVYQYDIPYFNEGSLMSEYNFSAQIVDREGVLVKLKGGKEKLFEYCLCPVAIGQLGQQKMEVLAFGT